MTELTDEQIRAVFLSNGFTVKEGQTDLKPYVFQAARALLALAAQPAQEGERTLQYFIDAQIEAHGTLRAVARAVGLDAGYLSRLRYGERDAPSDKALAALGVEKIVTYRPIAKAAAMLATKQEQP